MRCCGLEFAPLRIALRDGDGGAVLSPRLVETCQQVPLPSGSTVCCATTPARTAPRYSERAVGAGATVRYEIFAPGGERVRGRRFGGTCTVERGMHPDPRLVIRMKLVDFLRLMITRLGGVQAFMTGKLKVSGDLFYQRCFDSATGAR